MQICGVQATMQHTTIIHCKQKKKVHSFNSTQPRSKNRAITVGFQLYVASWISEWQPPGRQKHPVRQNKTLTHALTLKNRPQYTFLHPKIGLRNHTRHYNPHTFSINHHYIITFTPLSTCNSSRFILSLLPLYILHTIIYF